MAGKTGIITYLARRVVAALGSLILMLAVSAGDTARAHPVRFIASTGSDANNCTRGTPCLTLQRGIDRTAAGSELIILDSGDFGDGATIDKSITISAIGVSATIGGGITINSADATVVLRGLRLNGAGTSGSGIHVIAAAAVHIVDCEIQSFGTGIASNLSANVKLFISGSMVRNNSLGGLTTGSGGLLAVDNSRFERNGTTSTHAGLRINAGEARISRTIVVGNSGDGIRVSGGSVNINWTTAAHNGGSGYFVSASGFMTVEQSVSRGNVYGMRVVQTTSTGVISASVVTNNATGLSAVAGNRVWTRGNNTVSGNMNNVSGTLQTFNGI